MKLLIERDTCCVDFCIEIPACEFEGFGEIKANGKSKSTINTNKVTTTVANEKFFIFNDFSLIPNPANEQVQIAWQPFLNTDVLRIRIFNNYYSLVEEVEVSNQLGSKQISLTNYPSGMYVVELSTLNNSTHQMEKRIIKRLIVTK